MGVNEKGFFYGGEHEMEAPRAGSVRRRHKAGRGEDLSGPRKEVDDSDFIRRLKRFDAYAKVEDDLRVRTESGATVTVVLSVLLVVMVFTELTAYLRGTEQREHLVVDTTMGQKLRINVDMTFHRIPCLDLHVDAMDVAGDNQLDVEHNMLKQRLSSTGEMVGEAFTEEVSENGVGLEVSPDYCGSCFGAESAVLPETGTGKRCCNSCRSVNDAYAKMGWTAHDIRRTAEQCIREKHLEVPLGEDEGCALMGFMLVNKVAGNFHMAMGESMMRDGRHVHQFNVDEAKYFNISHTIHHLSFGEPYPGMRDNPLDRTERIVDEEVGTGLFQYFMKLVPTIYLDGTAAGGGTTTVTSQFTYTHKFRSVYGYSDYHASHDDGGGGGGGGGSHGGGHGGHADDTPHHHAAHGEHDGKDERPITQYLLPGVFFVYDISPFMMEVTRTSTPFSHFLIRLCAVVGGLFTVSGMLDAALFHLGNRLRRRSLLG